MQNNYIKTTFMNLLRFRKSAAPYAYRSGWLVLIVVLLAVSLQVIKAARANPPDSLKYG